MAEINYINGYEIVDAQAREDIDNIEDTYATVAQLNTETTSRQNADNTLQNQITSLASGAPLVASSTDDMTDTTRVYVNTTDGHWYWYNGTAWTDGGTYQATEIADNSINIEMLDSYLKNNDEIISENVKVSPLKKQYLYKIIDVDDYPITDKKYVANNGTIVDDNGFKYYTLDLSNEKFTYISVDNYGNIVPGGGFINDDSPAYAFIRDSYYSPNNNPGWKTLFINRRKNDNVGIKKIYLYKDLGGNDDLRTYISLSNNVYKRYSYLNNTGYYITNLQLSVAKVNLYKNYDYYISISTDYYGGFYDENDSYLGKINISGTRQNGKIINIPENAKYMLINFKWDFGGPKPIIIDDYVYCLPKETTASPSLLSGKNIAIFGDSRTWYDGQNYTSSTKPEIRGTVCTGYQQTIKNITDANITSYGYNGETSTQICSHIKETNLSKYDIVVLDGGVNDFIVGGTLGTIQPIGSTFNTSTVYGAWQDAIEHILTNYPNIKIILNTPFVAWKNTNEILPENIAMVKKNIADLYSLSCNDLYHESQLNLVNRGSLYADDVSLTGWYLHLNDDGNVVIGKQIASYILSHM